MSENQRQGKKAWWRKKGNQAKELKPEQVKPKGNYAFIDSQNLNLGVQKMGWKMDWHKLRLWLAEKYGVTHAYMFIGYMQENEALYEQMYEHGFLVVLKPTLEIKAPSENNAKETGVSKKSQVKNGRDTNRKEHSSSDQSSPEDKEKTIVKGNIDADLVLYAMKELPNYEKAILVSGDGDFFGLIEYLAQQGKLEKVLTPNWRYSTLLKDFSQYIEDINAHRRELSYRDFRKSRNNNTSRQASK